VAEGATLPEVRELEAEYEILAELGRGGMSVVYLARDRELGRDVAIKVIHAAMGVDEIVVARQLTEARTVAQLQHPNVVAIHAVKRLSTRGLALVMQYIPGRSLGRAIHEDGHFTPERTEAVLSDIAAALAYAHARGVVHRDVKPENIFLNDETGRALLSDFGIALSAEAGRQEPNADLLVGTPAYMSPEQIDGVVIDGRSDLFSLGIIGYEMLLGIRSWVDDPVSDVMYRQKFEPLPSLAELRPDVPDRLRTVLDRSVQKERADRWDSAAAFLGALSDDEWVPGASSPAGGPGTNRVAAHLAGGTPRGTVTPVSKPSPLETVQFRRPALAPEVGPSDEAPRPPHRGMFDDRRRRNTAPRRASDGQRLTIGILGLLVAIAAVAAAAVQFNPDLRARARQFVGPSGSAAVAPQSDSVQAARFAALRDSAIRAESAMARRAVDSAAAAVASADSSNAARLLAARDSVAKAAARQAESTRVARARAEATVAAAAPPPAPAPAPPRPESTRVAAAPPPIRPASPSPVSAGGAHSCVVSVSDVLCWGANDRGQLGDGSTTAHTAMVRVAGTASFAVVSASADHSCALARSGGIYCWGSNEDGQLGTGDATDHSTPSHVSGDRVYKAVATGGGYSCALSVTGEAYCWGRNSYGQLGTGSTASASTPVKVATNTKFVALAASTSHTCALDAVGTAYCWGQNAYGQLGDGSTILRTVPVQVAGGLYFRAIATGGAHTCAITSGGEPYCWGRNSYGQLGTGGMEQHDSPIAVTTNEHMVAITAGIVHSCGLGASGVAYCWGRNSYGQLGDGTTADHMTPVKVTGVTGLTAIDASGSHTCAVTVNGATVCWGDNSDGQLGDGSTTHRSTPVTVGGAR
jgi:serine/threonine protein kinase/alpha-tubulin suppressor-like RCC1 family protein